MPFHLVVGFLLNQLKGAYQREIDDFLRAVQIPQQVSAAAVCKARCALKSSVFSELNATLLQHAAEVVQPTLWRTRRIMAVDGSVLNLPKTPGMFEAFGGQRMSKSQGSAHLPMARFSQLYDVSTGLSWHAILDPYAIGEAVAATEHLQHAPADALILYDRGYPSYFLIAQHVKHVRDFCMRVPRGFSPETDVLFADDSNTSVEFLLKPNAKARALCKEHAQPIDPVRVRAVRVVLPAKKTKSNAVQQSCIEVLVTTLLDTKAYPDDTFGALYNQRWTIEGDFRHQKSRLQLENWTGKSAVTVRQDVFARVLSKNVVQVLIAEAQRRLDLQRAQAKAAQRAASKHRKRINATVALHLSKFKLIAYLLKPNAENLEPLVSQMMKNTNAQRFGRSYERLEKRGKSNRYPVGYKQTA